MSYQLSVQAQDILCVSGSINLTNVMRACARGKELLTTMPAINIDLAAVEQCDSSSLAMLVEWMRCAQTQHKKIKVINMPQAMLDLGRVCGLDTILPIARV